MVTAELTAPVARRLPARIRIGYSAGSLVTGAFGTVPGLLLLPYLTDTLGVTAGVAGLLVLAPKAWDVVVNPVAGRLSDRTRSRWGARRPYLLVGGLALAVLFASMFAGVYTGGQGAAWVCVAFLATATAFAFFQVPYVAMPAEMTEGIGLSDPYGERTRMMTWRVASLALTILVSGAVAPIVVEMFGQGDPGAPGDGHLHRHADGHRHDRGLRADPRSGRRHGDRERDDGCAASSGWPGRTSRSGYWWPVSWRRRRGWRRCSPGCSYFADASCTTTSATSLLFVCVVGPAILVMPLWNRVGARIGKLKGYVAASLTLTIATFGLVAAPLLPTWAVYAVVGAIGVGYAGQQLFGLAMLPDCIAYDTARTGRRQAGVFTGLWTAGETLGLALGPAIFAVTLQLFGYASGTSGSSAAADRRRPSWACCWASRWCRASWSALALLFLRAYDLTADRLAGMAGPDTNLSDLRPS